MINALDLCFGPVEKVRENSRNTGNIWEFLERIKRQPCNPLSMGNNTFLVQVGGEFKCNCCTMY